MRRLKPDVRAAIVCEPCAYRHTGNCNGGLTVDHVIPVAMRRVYRIPFDDARFLVSACSFHNVKKATRRYYPRGFDKSLLPGKGWQEWDGGPHLEVKR